MAGKLDLQRQARSACRRLQWPPCKPDTGGLANRFLPHDYSGGL